MEVAFLLPFSVLIFRAFVASIPRELDEAAIIDGASPLRLFFSVIFPLLRPAVITVVVVATVAVYNDFVNPLYFLPGTENATVQLTLFNFQSQFNTRWNLLFADVLLITIPPLIAFIIFQRQIVSGMTAGRGQGLRAATEDHHMPAIVDLRCQLPDGRRGHRPRARAPDLAGRPRPCPTPARRRTRSRSRTGPISSSVTFSTGADPGDDQVAVEAPGGPLWSREVRFYRVRLQVGGSWTEWSPVLRVEAGLLRPENWRAEAITLPDDPGATRPRPRPPSCAASSTCRGRSHALACTSRRWASTRHSSTGSASATPSSRRAGRRTAIGSSTRRTT